MTRFLEEPLPAILIGTALVAVLLIVYLQLRSTALLVAIGAVLVATFAAVIVENRVVTPKEEIETALYELAQAVEDNDLTGVLRLISPTARRGRNEAEYYLERVEFEQARVLGTPRITVRTETDPPSAISEFRGLVRGHMRKEGHAFPNVSQYRFTWNRNPEGQWQIVDYTRTEFRR